MPAQKDSPTTNPQALASAAAEEVLAHALEFSEVVEHAAVHWHALSDYFANEELSHLRNSAEREKEADSMAFYAIGIEIGRRLAGVR